MNEQDETVFGASKKVLFSLLIFFFIISAYWTLKPMRTSGVIKAFGTDYYPLFKQGLLIILPVILAFYFFLTCYLSRRALFNFFTGFFVVVNLLFWGLYLYFPSIYLKAAFFFYVDANITIMVTIFFTYLNQIFDTKEAGKVWAYIGSGGLLGGILGSSISGWAGVQLGNNIILVAAMLLVPIFFLINSIENQNSVKALGCATLCPHPEKEKETLGKIFKTLGRVLTEGLKIVFVNKYLLAIAAIIGIYEIISTNVDFIFNFMSSERFTTSAEMGAYQGRVFFTAQVVSLFVMVVITPFIHRRCGIVHGLFFLPGILLVGSLIFLPMPTLLIATLLIGGEAATAYSINQISKEILYIPLDNISKVKGKAFIDMFILRGAKAVGATFLLGFTLYLQTIGYSTNLLITINLFLLVIWFYAIYYVSIGYKEYSDCATD